MENLFELTEKPTALSRTIDQAVQQFADVEIRQ